LQNQNKNQKKVMYKFSSVIFVSTISAFLFVPPTLAQFSNFGDVRGYWGEEYVTTLANLNVIGGFPDGSFKPNADITRAQFAAIAVKAFNLPSSNNTRSFVDVRSNYWAASAISAVSNSGLVTGFPDGTFRPEDRITRAQALVILAKALGNRATPNANQLDRYTDRQAVPEWATESVSKAANARIIVNFPENNRIAPNNLATRGEVAALMYQTLFRIGDRNLNPLTIGTLDNSSAPNNPNNNPPTTSALTIERIEINPNNQTLKAGDELLVTVSGTPRARGSFRLDGINDSNTLEMSEVESGLYEGRYTIRRSDRQVNSRLSVTLSRQGSQPITRQFSRRIAINLDGSNNPNNPSNQQSLRPTLINVNNDDPISLPMDLVGQTAPDANVRVTIQSVRTVIGIIEIPATLVNTSVRANRVGRFRVNFPDNNSPSGTRYRLRLQATQNNQTETSEFFLRQR
jgi:S-layer homology domain